jgi:hypothetical protein
VEVHLARGCGNRSGMAHSSGLLAPHQRDNLQPTQPRHLMQLTLIGWLPRTTAALLLVSDNHLLVAKLILATAVSSWQMCSSRTVVIGPDIHM